MLLQTQSQAAGTKAPPSSCPAGPETVLRGGDECGKDLLTNLLTRGGIDAAIQPTVGPDGIYPATEGHDAFVVAVLIAGIRAGVGGTFIAHSGGHFDIGSKGEATAGLLAAIAIGLGSSRVISRIVPAAIDTA